MIALERILGVASLAVLATSLQAGAQDAQPLQPAPAEQLQPAQQQAGQQQAGTDQSRCLQNLQALNDQMRDDGYWLGGWNYAGTAAVGGAPGQPATMPAPGATPTAGPARDPATGQPVATTQIDDVTGTVADPGSVVTPWGRVDWTQRPRFEISTLFDAAVVLANRGNEQGCEIVVQSIEGIYGQYTAQLQELGVEPDEVSGWRQEQIVLSKPVTEFQGTIQIDDVLDSDLRNAEDEDLGEIEDVVLDPQTGQIRYAVVSYGGFLGLGENRVMIPWEQLRVTPGMNTFVLPVSEEAIENAPKLERTVRPEREVAEVDQYWQERLREAGIQPQ